MAELNTDSVTCPHCLQIRDRAQYSQCPNDGEDLWAITARPAPISPLPPTSASTPSPATAAPDTPGILAQPPRTVLDHAHRAPRHVRIQAGGTEFTLDAGQTLPLGRDEQYPTATALSDHTNVSRFHAVMRYDGDRVYVTDTTSTNGTFVNDTQLPAETEYELRPGQSLRLAADVEIDVRWKP